MSNLLINWRFWTWHLQVVRLRDWRGEIAMGRSPVAVFRNAWQTRADRARTGAPAIQFYQGGWIMLAIGAAALTAVLL